VQSPGAAYDSNGWIGQHNQPKPRSSQIFLK
jgi:hypothetical protein